MPRYEVDIFWSEEDGGFIANVPELPYCSAFGETYEEALQEARKAMELDPQDPHALIQVSRLLFGSVALRVLQGSTSPLLMYRPLQRPDGTLSPVETHEPTRFRRVLALLDGSPLAEEVLGPASDLAQRFDGEIR